MNRLLPSLPTWVFAVVLLPSAVFAQEYCAPRGDVCEPSEPRSSRDQPPELPAVPRGMYVAPPRSGAIVAPSRSTSVRGGSITFPEFKIGLPSFSLPSLSRSRRGPEMRLDSSRAPYVPNPLYARGLIAQERDRRDLQRARGNGDSYDDACDDAPSPPPLSYAPAPKPSDTGMQQYRQRLDHLARQQEEIQRRMDQLLAVLQQSVGPRTAQRPPQPAMGAPRTTGLRPIEERPERLRPVQSFDGPHTASTPQVNVLRFRPIPDSEDVAQRSETRFRVANRDIRPVAASEKEEMISVVVPRKMYEQWCRERGVGDPSSDLPITRLPPTAGQPMR